MGERFCLEFLLGVRSRFEKKTKTKSKKEKKNICFLSRKKEKEKCIKSMIQLQATKETKKKMNTINFCRKIERGKEKTKIDSYFVVSFLLIFLVLIRRIEDLDIVNGKFLFSLV